MLWPMLAMGALGAVQGQRKQDRIAKMNEAQAETTRYSPWTGMKGQLQDTGGGAFDGALQGGLTGAALSQSFDGGGAEKAVTEGAASTNPAQFADGGNAFSDRQMMMGQAPGAKTSPMQSSFSPWNYFNKRA